MALPARHRAKLRGTDPVERPDAGIERGTDVVGIFPTEAAITRPVGAILVEQTEEWAIQRSRPDPGNPRPRLR
jgi:transposase-like protein